MAGLPKRTSLRSSPEDAAYYRRYHDSTLSWLQKGTPRADLIQELVRLGVPEKTAERIVVAVEQEHALSADPQGVPRQTRRIIVLTIVVVFGCSAVYIALEMAKSQTLKARYVLPAFLILALFSAKMIAKLFGKQGPLPPPPEPPT